jgi:hypothetical protein
MWSVLRVKGIVGFVGLDLIRRHRLLERALNCGAWIYGDKGGSDNESEGCSFCEPRKIKDWTKEQVEGQAFVGNAFGIFPRKEIDGYVDCMACEISSETTTTTTETRTLTSPSRRWRWGWAKRPRRRSRWAGETPRNNECWARNRVRVLRVLHVFRFI